MSPDSSKLTAALADRNAPLEGTLRGPKVALAEVYRQYAPLVARWAYRMGGPNIDVEEIVQEVFLAVHRKLAGFRGDSSLSTWLYRITQNTIRHRRRKERWRAWLAGSPEDYAAEVPSTSSASEALDQRQSTERVYRVLAKMKERHREVLVLFEIEEHSGEEIAELTGAKIATVWVWLHRARAEFAKRLAELEPELVAKKERK